MSSPDSPASGLPPAGTPPGPDLEPALRAVADVVAKLRGPDGCPWDRAQTLSSIKPHTLEETHELFEAIDALAAAAPDDPARPQKAAAVRDELGDLLLQVLLDAQIAADDGLFTLTEVADSLRAKLVRRHPHVFGEATAADAEQVKALWANAKRAEREGGDEPTKRSVFDGIPAGLPALAAARKLSSRAAAAGYDFPDRRMQFDKLAEELAEFSRELFDADEPDAVPAGIDGPVIPDEPIADPARRDRAEAELGDVLFVLANVARRWGLDPEQALLRSNRKFAARVRYIESQLGEKELGEVPLAEMEALYQQGKRRERGA
ncbi:nucleoside triphosphate pyrophosphohydrolase [Alienimonas californiensis]|uniref:Nucleoside triphosphate pyrophosphohydrolase n=1 Tax=Alienimonas californiensis TaxID=2527989 RepID=A0A517P993_9PLAN|nr:MazG family protein [Alienimonas californiensis]QDT15956.1 Nucleoside triphosphate pyrophosphohydrolase [Alienimonas californiensis]